MGANRQREYEPEARTDFRLHVVLAWEVQQATPIMRVNRGRADPSFNDCETLRFPSIFETKDEVAQFA